MLRFIAALLIVMLPASAYAHPAPDGFADLAERLSPAVVNISTAQLLEPDDGALLFPEGSPLERFNPHLEDDLRISNSLGSGFIIDPSGIVVTNNHVIDGADTVTVAIPDGRIFAAEVIGSDPVTDLAVLRMETDLTMPHVEFGDSDTSRPGDWVIAIGNPFGLGGTLTAGIVSARGRDAGGRYDDYIQSDVAINTGNSGGPLFDMDGNVIGVNTLIVTPTGTSAGISYSIPSNIVMRVVDQLIEFGETRRGWLGVSVQPVSAELAESFNLDSPYGAIISRIDPDGPASDIDLRRGDLVINYGGERVRDSRSFVRMVAETEIGAEVEIELIRRDDRITRTVTIGELAEEGEEGETRNGRTTPIVDPDMQGGNEIYGMTLAVLDAQSRRRYRVHPDAEGVLVTEVDPLSDAAGKVRPGDVIEEVEFTRVSSIAEIREIVGDADGLVRFQLNRGGQFVLQSIRP